MDLTREKTEQLPPGRRGFVSKAPVDLAAPFTVTIPGFSGKHFHEITRWMPRGETLPAVGDEVLVIEDDHGQAWVPAWWPL